MWYGPVSTFHVVTIFRVSHVHISFSTFLFNENIPNLLTFTLKLEAACQCESLVEATWNMMAHTQKPDFVFRWNVRVHLNRWGRRVQSTTGSRGVHISGSNAGYTMFQGSVKSTGYPLNSPVSPLLPLPCVSVSHHTYRKGDMASHSRSLYQRFVSAWRFVHRTKTFCIT